MRRVLVSVLALSLGLLSAPGDAAPPPAPATTAPPAAPALPRPPGRIPVGQPASGAEWARWTRAAVAGTGGPAADVLAEYEASPAAIGDERDVRRVLLPGDLDGDRVSDVVVYRSLYEERADTPDGFTELTLYSGRTGALRWKRRFDDLAMAQPVPAKVGRAGLPGIVLVHLEVVRKPANLLEPLTLLAPPEERRMRFVAVTGSRGRIGYDRTVTNADGKGDIQYAGTFDAYPGGGTELLVGRIKPAVSATLIGDVAGLFTAEPFVLHGDDGTLRSVRPAEPVFGQGVAYLPLGDVDRDRRDDFARIVRVVGTIGTVSVHGVIEEQTLWTAERVTVGYWVWPGGTADVTGNGRRDVLLNTSLSRSGIWIGGLPDLPVLSPPRNASHGLLFDGATGAVRWDRTAGNSGSHDIWGHVDRDGKQDVLVSAEFTGDRDGIRLAVVDGAGKVLRSRDVTVTPPPNAGSRYVFAGTEPGGDLDGDGLRDVQFYVVSSAFVLSVGKVGLFLVGRNHAVVTGDFPLGGTLDGGTDDRVRFAGTRTSATYTTADGWRGGSYWTVRADAVIPSPLESVWWSIAPLRHARGRCDGVVLLGSARDADWFDVLDGATGRVRWSLTYSGTRPETTVRVSGRAARCR